MKNGFRFSLAVIVGIFAMTLCAQELPSPEIFPGFKLRSNGVIDIGPLFAEVNYYDSTWTISQQHDKYELASPDTKVPATQPVTPAGGRTFTGILTTAQGPANLTETVAPAEGGVDYSAIMTSDKALPTNELSVAFLLPTASFAGKQITIDGDATMLPADAAPKGQPQITAKDEVHEVDLPLPNGTLTIKGSFKFLVQDDREWGDPRYSMRLMFTPASGDIKESKAALQMRLTPAQK